MFKIFAGLAVVSVLSACSTTPAGPDETVAANDMPEYRTGSIIAKKKTSSPDNLKSMSAEQLEEVRQNSAIPMR